MYNRAKALLAAGWIDDGGDDACGLDEVNAPETNPTLISIDEEELACKRRWTASTTLIYCRVTPR